MEKGKIITDDASIKEILDQSKTVAVLGLSPKPERDSNMVARYLKEKGYRVIPVRPGQKEILGEKAYGSIEEIDEPIDIVDVFRRSELILPHAKEALRIKPKVFWMQLGIENKAAAEMFIDAGFDVVIDLCIKVEHDRLCK